MKTRTERIEELMNEALPLGPEDRASFLAEACGQDSDLRQSVEALLDAHDQAGDFLPDRPRSSSEVFEAAGTVVGRYRLLEKIGEGGFGVVYMAEQQEPVRRKVALKIIKVGMDTKQVVARFEAERQALALMDHPHIAGVLDGGATDTGRPYFVMDLVRGIPITQYCDKQKLTTRERLELFIPVCQAVQHAHQKGIIHRDLKPSNVMVTLSDGVPYPIVIDFGVAKAINRKLAEQTRFTHFGQMIGTPAYMAPEQAEMSPAVGGDVDTRSDIFSLGVLLYELLTGSQPFPEQELCRAGWAEMQRMIAEKKPAKPSTRLSTLTVEQRGELSKRRKESPERMSVLLRGDLDWIVMKCLEKDRRRRYDTANGLAMDVQRHLANEPVTARPPSRLYEFQKAFRRHKLGFAAAGAVAAALVLGLGLATVALSREKAARQRAVDAEQTQIQLRTQAQKAAARSAQVAQSMKDMLHSFGPSLAAGRDTQLLEEILENTANRMHEELADQPEVEAELRNTIAFVYVELGRYGKAEEMYRQSLSLIGRVGDENALLADTLLGLAQTLHLADKFPEAEPYARQAVSKYTSLYGREHPSVGASLNILGLILYKQHRPGEAEPILREALAINRRTRGDKHPQVGRSLSRLGWTLLDLGRLPEAVTTLRNATAIQRQVTQSGQARFLSSDLLTAPEVELGWTLTFLAAALERQGNLDEALAARVEAFNGMKSVLGADHLHLTAVGIWLAQNLAAQGRSPKAVAVLCETAQGGNPRALNAAAWFLATAPDEGVHDGERALALAERAVAATPPTKVPWRVEHLDTLAAAHAELGQFAEAISVEQEALTLLPEQEKDSKDVFEARIRLFRSGRPYREYRPSITLLMAAGRLAEAEALLRKELLMRRTMYDKSHPKLAETQADLTFVMLRQKK